MKKIFLIILYIIIQNNLYGQGNFTLPQTVVGSKTYNCKVDNTEIWIEKQNQPILYLPLGIDGCVGMFTKQETEKRAINAKIVEALGSTRLDLLKSLGENKFIISIGFNNQGQIEVLKFRLNKNTNITPQELSILEDKLREIQFIIPTNCQSRFQHIVFNYMVHLNRLVY
ncbi:MAG: hypothetical protein MUC49_20805 [Raineya sp.]|jgi:hypothetical protein|nr:hypothetical protein [Raineya sp.]